MTEENETSGKDEMYLTLLSVSSRDYSDSPLTFARVAISTAAVAYALRYNDEPDMTQQQYAIATQAAAVALVMARVPDDELAENINAEKVAVAMLEYAMSHAAMVDRLQAERQEEMGQADD